MSSDIFYAKLPPPCEGVVFLSHNKTVLSDGFADKTNAFYFRRFRGAAFLTAFFATFFTAFLTAFFATFFTAFLTAFFATFFTAFFFGAI